MLSSTGEPMGPRRFGEFVHPAHFSEEAEFCDFDLAGQVTGFVRSAIDYGLSEHLLRPHASLGGVVTFPQRSKEELREHLHANGSYSSVWFGFGWGDQQDRYMANAFRKLVPCIEELRDSLVLKRDPGYEFPNPVDSQDADGRFPLGSFPHGGAKIISIGGIWIAAAVSGLHEIEDDAVAGMAALFTGCQLLKHKFDSDNPLSLFLG